MRMGLGIRMMTREAAPYDLAALARDSLLEPEKDIVDALDPLHLVSFPGPVSCAAAAA